MMLPICTFLSFVTLATAATLSSRESAFTFTAQTIAQLKTNETFFENIAVRPNGDLITTLFEPIGALYLLQKPYSSARKLSMIHNFNKHMDPEGGYRNPSEEYTAVLGIAQVPNRRKGKKDEADEVYIVSGGRFRHGAAPQDGAVNGSMAIWEVRLTPNPSLIPKHSVSNGSNLLPPLPKVRIKQIARLPAAGILNGVTSIPGADVVVIADNGRGLLWRLDLSTGISAVILDSFETRPKPVGSTGFAANGVKVSRDGAFLYFSNSDLASIYRMRIDRHGFPGRSAAIQQVANVSSLAIGVDDFIIDRDDNILVATHIDNMLILIQRDGRPQVVLGSPGQLTVAGDTAVQFGRTERDRDTLYITTNGGVAAPVNGTVIEPAKIVAVDVASLYY